VMLVFSNCRTYNIPGSDISKMAERLQTLFETRYQRTKEELLAAERLPRLVQLVDLSKHTVLPGLIDTHIHPFIEGDDYQMQHLQRDSAYKTARGLRVLQQMLLAGWTTVRIAGDADVGFGAIALQRASEERLHWLPRVQAAAHYISVTGGGGDYTVSSEQKITADGRVCDGVEALRYAVRDEIKQGSKWIKFLASGAFMTAADSPEDVHFAPDELLALTQEAGRRRVPVMAHAHAAAAIRACVGTGPEGAGVRSIEHGTFIDAEAIRLMAARRNIWLVPTLFIG
jgi:imidazolonepropionase-like amidohydrolase